MDKCGKTKRKCTGIEARNWLEGTEETLEITGDVGTNVLNGNRKAIGRSVETFQRKYRNRCSPFAGRSKRS